VRAGFEYCPAVEPGAKGLVGDASAEGENLHRCGTWLRDGLNPCRLLEDQEHAFQISRPGPARFPLRFTAN